MSQNHKSNVRRSEIPHSASTPLTTPLYTAVAYVAADADALDDQYEGRTNGYTYAREGHPNATVLARKIDQMEGATGGLITGSGMSAIAAIYLGILKSGDHIVAGNQIYGRNLRLLTQDLPKMGITATLVDPTDAQAIEKAIKPETALIFVEVVANPTIRIADMEAITEIAHRTDTLLAVDNTFATPLGYRPLEHGADIVMHSVTKLLAGHSDVTLGYVVARDAAHNKAMEDAIVTWGLTPSPFDCWQAERGIHSFDIRFERAQSNARRIADCLAELPGVEQVLYPACNDHPDHNRAQAVLGDAPGNMLSFRMTGGRDTANRFIRAAKHLPFAPTLGDVATTLSHPPSSSHRAMTEAERQAIGITEAFFRVSVGIEDPELLCREFTEAVEEATA